MRGYIYAQLVALAFAGAALADNTTATSTANSSEVTGGLKEKIALSYWGQFKGPAVNNMSSVSPTVDGEQNPDHRFLIDSTVSGRYKLSPNLVLGPDFRFKIKASREQDAALSDPWFTVQANKVVNRSGLNLDVNLRTYAPLTDASQQNNMVTAFRTNQILSYEVPGTRLTVGTYSYLRYDFFSSANAHNMDNTLSPEGTLSARPDELFIYVAPNATYQLSSKVQATLWWDFVQAHKKYGAGGLISNDSAESNDQDIQPGINWDITPNVSFNPYLNIYPSNPTLSATSIQAILSAKLL